MKDIETKVVHSQSKTAWNVIGDTLCGKYKIARVPYHILDNNENDILSVKNKHEALEYAQFISRAFNHAWQKIAPNSDYEATLRVVNEFKDICNGSTLSEYCQERINSAEPNCT